MTQLELGEHIHQLFALRSVVGAYELRLDKLEHYDSDIPFFDEAIQEYRDLQDDLSNAREKAGDLARKLKPHVPDLEDKTLTRHPAYRTYLQSVKQQKENNQ